MHANAQPAYVIVRTAGFELGPTFATDTGPHPSPTSAARPPPPSPPLPPRRGLWPSCIGTAWASPLASLPAADAKVTSRAPVETVERVTVRGGPGGGGREEGGGEYMARSQPIVYTLSLTQSLTHSLLHTSPPPRLLTCSSSILQLTDSVLRTFARTHKHTLLCDRFDPRNSCATVSLNRGARFRRVASLPCGLYSHREMRLSADKQSQHEPQQTTV